jgi:hypothetical protein
LLAQASIKGAVDSKPLVAQPVLPARLGHHRRQKLHGDVAAQQPLAVLAEGACIPHRLAQRQAHKPTKSQMQIHLIHQCPFAAYAVQHLQQHRTQQLFATPYVAVNGVETCAEPSQRLIGKRANPPQRMVRRDSLVQPAIAEQLVLLPVVSTHVVETSASPGSLFCYLLFQQPLSTCSDLLFSPAGRIVGAGLVRKGHPK